MNYAGKFDAQLPADGSGLHSNGYVHAETVSPRATHAPSDAIVVLDAHLLFNAEFKRSGVDLILSRDSQELVLHDYFKGEKRAALASPDGAHLTGDTVNALAGHVEYAQADGSAAAGHVIGHVTKLVGTATAIRNGVSIILNNGDNVEKGDVVQSGSDSTLGITFIDGTVFGLSSNARMVLNEMVYDPNGSNNSSLLSLVAGTISFVAGETAKHGDMKVDTPVATMGIRGTAVLVEIDFDVPGQNGVPDAKFQVLVEPDGTTGSYILFDKTTLTPLAVVDKAGQQINISNGILSQTTNPLSPEIQKLITDVFSLKFSDNSNTKTLDHFTDTIIPLTLEPIKLASGVTATPVVLIVETPAGSPTNSGNSPANIGHIGLPPSAASLNLDGQLTTSFQTSELAGKTADTVDFDAVSGRINFVDINLGDRPTVSSKFESFVYKGAQGNVLSLNAQQKADVAALELKLTLKPDPGNVNFGTVLWTYNDPANHLSVPDKAFDFLAAGETLQLTYWLTVDNNYAPSDQTTTVPITITITGTNDVPVITTAQQEIHFVGGKTTQGGFLTTNDSTSGTLAFADPDLTDTHTIVSTNLTSASLLLGGKTLDKAALDQDFPAAMKAFESALSASVTTDSTGTGAGTISWQLAKISAFLADIVPNNETLVLDYTVEVKDSQGAIATKTIEAQIKGNNTPAVVWVETVEKGSSAPGDWNDGSNWETGIAPTASDDAIIITDQLIGQTPVYPVTVKAGEVAAAKSVAMNDFNDNTPATLRPELDIKPGASLTIGDGGLSLNADAILKNFGTLSVGSIASLLGKAEISGQSDLENSGLIKLYQGGDFTESKTITNSGTIEVAGGALNVQVAIANSGGFIRVDDGTTLTLSGAEIIGGTIDDSSPSGTGGTIDVAGDSKIDGNASLNNGYVTIEGGKVLTLDNVTVAGTTFTDTASGAILSVDATDTLILSGVTIDGGTINDGTGTSPPTGGTIEVSGSSTISGASLNHGRVTVDGNQTLTLDNDTVTGTTFTDTASGAILSVDAADTLTLSGVTIHGGTINDGTGNTLATGGTIEISGSSTISSANLNHGGVTIDGNQTLTLDNVTVAGTTFTDTASGAILSVDATDTLILSGVTIDGGTINDGTGTSPPTGGTIEVSGSSTISGASLNHGRVAVDGNQTLTLDNDTVTGTTFTDTASGAILSVDAADTLTLSGVTIHGGTINDGTGNTLATGGTIEIRDSSTISSTNLNHGGVTVDGNQTLTLDNVTATGTTFADTASGAIIQIDDTTTLTLSGAEIIGGTINDGTIAGGPAASTGQIDVTGDSKIDGNASLNNGYVTIEGGKVLTLDNVTATGTTFADTASGAIVQIDDTTTLTLSGAEIIGGTINDGTIAGGPAASTGQIDVTGDSKIDGNASLNNGYVTIEGGKVLTLDNVTVNGTIFTGLATGGTIQIDSGDTLVFNGATINGGTLKVAGELDSTGTSLISGATIVNSSHIDVVSGTLTIDPAPVTNAGMIEVKGDSTLVLSGETITNTDGTTNGIIQVDKTDATHFATLDLDTSTISGGTLNISGELVSTGNSSITGAAITNSGIIDVTSGTLTIDATSTFNNTGTLETNGGTLIINAAFSGNLEIKGNATLELGSSLANAYLSATVTFDPASTGTLKLDYSQHFNGTIIGFGAGKTIDLTDIDYSGTVTDSWNSATDTLTISDGIHSAALKFSGTYGQNIFALTSDTNGKTEVVLTSAQASLSGLDSAGNAVANSPVTATLTDPNATGITYQWLDDGVAITGATSASYTPTVADEGKALDVVIGFTDDGIAEQVTALAGTVAAAPVVATINFDDAPAGTSGTELSSYFANYGITLSAAGANAIPTIDDDRNIYGGGIVNATTGHNLLGESGGFPVSYTVTFAHALTSFAFDRVQENAGPSGSSYPQWTATAFDAQGHVLGTVGEGETLVFGSPVPAAHYGLTGADIAYVTFTGNDQGHDGFANVLTDSWVLTEAPTVPAATTLFWNTSSGDWTTSATDWSPSAIPNSADDATVSAASASPYTVTIANGEFATADTLHLDSAAATIADSGSLNLTGDLVIDHGTFDLEGGSLQALSIEVAATGTFEGINAAVDGPVSVSGVVEAIGTLDFAGYVTGTGTFSIDPSSTLEFGGPVSTGSVVSFANAHDDVDGNGSLHLDSPSTFQGQVTGFATGDVLDIGGLSPGNQVHVFGAYNSATGTTLVTVTDNSVSTSVTLVGDYSKVLWATGDDGHGGVNIAMDTVTMTLGAGPYFPQSSVAVKVTVIDGLTHQPATGVPVTASFTSDAGQGAFNLINGFETSPVQLPTGYDGTANFTFSPLEFSGDFNIAALVGGVETLSQQLVVLPFDASNSDSSLNAVVNFSGPTETATLTLADQDFLHNPRPGDTVGWSNNGTYSPASGAGVTDANGLLVDTLTPTSDTTQTVAASFAGNSVSTSVNFVTMDSWINTSGGTWNDLAHAATNWSSGIPTAGEGVSIGSAGTYTVDVTAAESVDGLGTMATATLEIGAGGTLAVTGSVNSVIAGALTIDNGGEFLAENGTVQLSGAVTNNHVIEAQNGATVDVAGNIGGTGSIVADGAVVNAAGNLASTQAITIEGAGVVHLAQAEGGQITFSGAGMLALDAAPASGMTVSTFGTGDSIDLTNLAFSSSPLAESLSWDAPTNTLTVVSNSVSESVHFAESHSLSDFTLTADPLGTGGTDIVYNAPLNYAVAANVEVAKIGNGGNSIMAGINNNGVAIITGDAYELWLNGQLISLPGAPVPNHSGFAGFEPSAGINDSQQLAVSNVDAQQNILPEIYLGIFDPSTGLNDGSGGSTTILSEPDSLRVAGPSTGAALGINDLGQVVGYFQHKDNTLYIVYAPPDPEPGYGSNYFSEAKYGFIYEPGSGTYTIVDAGKTAAGAVPAAYQGGLSGPVVESGWLPVIPYTVLTGINNKGIAVGYYMDNESVQHAFIFNDNTHTFTWIPDLAVPRAESDGGYQATSTVATGINDQGIIVGYYAVQDESSATAVTPLESEARGFVYDINTGQFLSTDFGFALTGINDRGVVTGQNGQALQVANLNPINTIDNGGKLYVSTADNDTIHFAGGTGELVLSDSTDFHGQITGFTGTAPDAAHSDVIDLVGINFLTLNSNISSKHFQATYATGFLVVTDGFHPSASFSFENYTGGFAYTSDGHGGTLIFDPPSGPATIANGELYEVTSASSDTMTFTGSAGALQLDHPAGFTGHIAGFAGTAPDAAHSDVLDLAGIDFNSTKFAETYQSATGELGVTDGTNSAKFTLDNFNGTLGFASDGHGGTAITGVSATSQSVGAVVVNDPGQSIGPVIMHDPGPAASSTIVASAPNQTLSGLAVSDTFVFNFAGVGHDTVANFHPTTDTLQFSGTIFANAQAVLNATQDDGHGNTVVALDGHDTITLSGVHKAQLHISDFHVV